MYQSSLTHKITYDYYQKVSGNPDLSSNLQVSAMMGRNSFSADLVCGSPAAFEVRPVVKR
jgi:hypothetical protein